MNLGELAVNSMIAMLLASAGVLLLRHDPIARVPRSRISDTFVDIGQFTCHAGPLRSHFANYHCLCALKIKCTGPCVSSINMTNTGCDIITLVWCQRHFIFGIEVRHTTTKNVRQNDGCGLPGKNNVKGWELNVINTFWANQFVTQNPFIDGILNSSTIKKNISKEPSKTDITIITVCVEI